MTASTLGDDNELLRVHQWMAGFKSTCTHVNGLWPTVKIKDYFNLSSNLYSKFKLSLRLSVHYKSMEETFKTRDDKGICQKRELVCSGPSGYVIHIEDFNTVTFYDLRIRLVWMRT